MQHVFWRDLTGGDDVVGAAWRRWWSAFDGFLARVLDAAGPETTVIVFSDHGFGPVRRYFHVNRWLLRRGWLVLRDDAPLGGADGLMTAVDWDRTRAIGLSEYGDVRLNLRGREPRGIVAPGAEAEAVRAAIARELATLDDGAPGPAVDAVLDGARVWRGPFADDGPDLIVRLRGHETLCRIDGRGTDLRDPDGPLFVPADRPEHYKGAHRADGLLALWGAGVRPGTADAADAADLAPTVCHLLGLPLDRAMDGRVLREALAVPIAARPSTWEDGVVAATAAAPGAYTATEEAHVAEQLRSLGYVE
jgi:predicted AlkP superfamily phosphohydrolase/phosphomutase